MDGGNQNSMPSPRIGSTERFSHGIFPSTERLLFSTSVRFAKNKLANKNNTGLKIILEHAFCIYEINN